MAVSQEDTPEVEEPFWEIEKILRWRKVKRRNKIIKEFLVLWKNFPMDEASWITASQFLSPSYSTNSFKKTNQKKRNYK